MKLLIKHFSAAIALSIGLYWWAVEGPSNDPRDNIFLSLYCIGWISPLLILLTFNLISQRVKRMSETLFRASVITMYLILLFQLLPIISPQPRDLGYGFLILYYPMFSIPFMILTLSISWGSLNLVKKKQNGPNHNFHSIADSARSE